MKFSSVMLCLLTMMSALSAQTVVNVRVLEYNGKQQKTPLKGVEVRVAGASTSISNANGECKLSFIVSKPGDKVEVKSIRKPGYQLFNTEVIDNWHLVKDEDQLVIVMCKTDSLLKLRNTYLSVAQMKYEEKLQVDERQIQKLKAAGEINQEECNKRIQTLYDEYEKRLDNIENYINRFVHVDLSELNQKEQEIIALVQAGDIDAAITRYDEMNLLEKYLEKTLSVNKLQNAEVKLDSSIQNAISARDSIITSIKNQASLLEMIGLDYNEKASLDWIKTMIKTGEKEKAQLYLQLLLREMEIKVEYYPLNLSSQIQEVKDLLKSLAEP